MSLGTWETLLLILLVVNALALGVMVLIQQGKGADVGAAFGSGASSAVFGAQGAGSFLTRVTTWLAIGFFVISFGLAYLAKERAAGMQDVGVPQTTEPRQAPAETERPDTDLPDIPGV